MYRQKKSGASCARVKLTEDVKLYKYCELPATFDITNPLQLEIEVVILMFGLHAP